MSELTFDEVMQALTQMPEEERKEALKLADDVTGKMVFVPNIGPQTSAYYSEADELLYGGEAGGGKSQLLLGLAYNEHHKSRILRRINQDVKELYDAAVEMVGDEEHFLRNPPQFHNRANGKFIEFRGCELERDKQRFKGQARDFIGYDELADFLESQYKFINIWNRSTNPEQRCRIVGATNGPTTAEGMWIVKRWGPWLDPKHPNPAKDGELRWFLAVEDEDIEVDGPGPHMVRGKARRATSRTFIRSRLSDNPDLDRTDYGDRLQSLPEELRKVYAEGDFTVGMRDDDWQVIPTAWIDSAQQRWTDRPPDNTQMTAMAVDVAPSGGDNRVIAYRYAGWYAPLVCNKEVDRDGRKTAAAVVEYRRDNCPVVVDLGGGWGGDAIIAMKDNGIVCETYLGQNPSGGTTRDGNLPFHNRRAADHWRLREALDPNQEGGSAIALPPDAELKADLAAPRYEVKSGKIKVESKEDIKARLGRSPDRGDACIMCLAPGDQIAQKATRRRQGPPKIHLGYSHTKRRRH